MPVVYMMQILLKPQVIVVSANDASLRMQMIPYIIENNFFFKFFFRNLVRTVLHWPKY